MTPEGWYYCFLCERYHGQLIWLSEHGHDWKGSQRDEFLNLLTDSIRLVYPVR